MSLRGKIYREKVKPEWKYSFQHSPGILHTLAVTRAKYRFGGLGWHLDLSKRPGEDKVGQLLSPNPFRLQGIMKKKRLNY